MNRKKILKMIVTASAIAGSINLANTTVQATENTNNTNSIDNARTLSAIQKGKVVNVTTNLRVRADAGTNYKVIGYLNSGQEVTVKAEKNNWYRIEFNGKEGYVSKEYVEIIRSSNTSTSTSNIKGQVINISTSLNIRQAASTSSAILGTLKNSETFDIISKSGNWYNIKSGNITGFIAAEYVKELSGVANNTTTEPSTGATIASTGKVINISSNLRVRSQASSSSTIIGYLLNNQTVSIKGENGDWYRIDFKGADGYVAKEYIQKATATNTNTTPSTGNTNSNTVQTKIKGQVINITSTLNIRQSASTSSAILGTLTNGSTFDIISKNGSWYNIKAGNITGYIHSDYVKEVKENTNANNNDNNSTGNTQGSTNSVSSKGKVINITSSLNIRQSASTSSAILSTLTNGSTFDIISKTGTWYNIKVGNVQGYIHSDYVQVIANISTENNESSTVINKMGEVINITSNLRVRTAPKSTATVLGYLLNGQTVQITGQIDNWYKINYNNSTGYVSVDYIKIVDSSTPSDSTAKYNIILNAMKEHLGTPYVWGGAGELLTTDFLDILKRTYPTQTASGFYRRAEAYANKGYRAFDCSGLMQWGFKQAGITIGRSTWHQIEDGVEVSLNNLKPGDLLFYSNLTHVGMYMGNNQWIESPNSSANIRITTVPWSKIGRARRILQ